MAEQALKPWFQQSSRFRKRDLGPSPSPRNGQLGIEEDPGLHVRGPGTAAMALLDISSKALALWGGKPNSRGQENHRNASSRQSLCTAYGHSHNTGQGRNAGLPDHPGSFKPETASSTPLCITQGHFQCSAIYWVALAARVGVLGLDAESAGQTGLSPVGKPSGPLTVL